MSIEKQKYGIGQDVMVRSQQQPKYNCSHTIVMACEYWYPGSRYMNDKTQEVVTEPVGRWLYQVSKYPFIWMPECVLRPRPQPGIDWRRLQEKLKKPQPEHCA